MGPEIVWRLQHVWPRDVPDISDTNLAEVDDDEARRLVNEVEEVKRAFERFVDQEVVPKISRRPTRVGVVETLRLYTSEYSMNTDYLLLLSGILSGDGGVSDQLSERYTIAATEEVGRFSELKTYELGE